MRATGFGLGIALLLLIPGGNVFAAQALTPSHEIGVVAGAEEYELGSVAQLALARAGDLYVLDNLARRVAVFDTSGRFVRSYGAQGSGPAEIQAPWRIAVTPDGGVVVRDLQLERYTVFAADGRIAHTWPAPNQRAYWDLLQSDHLGRVYSGVRAWSDSVSPHYVLRFQPDAGPAAADTLPLLKSTREMLSLPGGGYVDQPFRSEFFWAVGPDAWLWTAFGRDTVVVGWREGEGRAIAVSGRRHVPVPLGMRDSARSAAEEQIASRLGDGREARAAIGQINVPTAFHPILGLVADGEGRVWVRRPDEEKPADGVFEVFSPEGEVIATLSFSHPDDQHLDYSLLVASRNVAYVPSVDELGVYRILRYDLPESLRGEGPP